MLRPQPRAKVTLEEVAAGGVQLGTSLTSHRLQSLAILELLKQAPISLNNLLLLSRHKLKSNDTIDKINELRHFLNWATLM